VSADRGRTRPFEHNKCSETRKENSFLCSASQLPGKKSISFLILPVLASFDSRKISIKMEINTEHWRNFNGRGNEILGEKPVHHKSYIDWSQDKAVYLFTFYTPM
jgi:hypothetical protein